MVGVQDQDCNVNVKSRAWPRT